MEKICCGGFYLGEGLELDGRTLKGTGGSGLPDPTGLPDGTALVAVNGEWKKQEGYGYTGEPAFEPIEWDGDMEGREYIPGGENSYYVRVNEMPISAEDIIGCTISYTHYGVPTIKAIEQEDIYTREIPGVRMFGVMAAMGGLDLCLQVILDDVEEEGTTIHKGVYFGKVTNTGVHEGTIDYISSLTAPSTVHQFDSALIPASGVEEFVVKFEMGEDGIISDKTWQDVVLAVNSGKLAKGILYEDGAPYFEFQFTGTGFIHIGLGALNTLQVMSIGYDGTPVWTFNITNYTLTPAT